MKRRWLHRLSTANRPSGSAIVSFSRSLFAHYSLHNIIKLGQVLCELCVCVFSESQKIGVSRQIGWFIRLIKSDLSAEDEVCKWISSSGSRQSVTIVDQTLHCFDFEFFRLWKSVKSVLEIERFSAWFLSFSAATVYHVKCVLSLEPLVCNSRARQTNRHLLQIAPVWSGDTN